MIKQCLVISDSDGDSSQLPDFGGDFIHLQRVKQTIIGLRVSRSECKVTLALLLMEIKGESSLSFKSGQQNGKWL